MLFLLLFIGGSLFTCSFLLVIVGIFSIFFVLFLACNDVFLFNGLVIIALHDLRIVDVLAVS